MNVSALIANRYNSLSQSERRVADYVCKEPANVVLMPIQILSQNSGSSEATVLRFCRSLGYSGYQDFKAALIPEVIRKRDFTSDTLAPTNDFRELTTDFSEGIAFGVNNTLLHLEEEDVRRVVQAITNAEVVVVIGLAASAGIARVLSGLLFSVGILAYPLSDRMEIERVSSLLRGQHVLVAISHSGETDEACIAVKKARQQGAFTVAVTNFSPSALDALADVTLLTCIQESVLGGYSLIPRIAQLSIFQLIVELVLQNNERNGDEQTDEGGII